MAINTITCFTQLALLFDNEFVVKYGYSKLLKCLIDDLRTLETTGITIDNKNIKGGIIYFCADNLGANSACGLIESFSSASNGNIPIIFVYSFCLTIKSILDYCRFCYGTDAKHVTSIQTHFNDSDFSKRTVESHRDDVEWNKQVNPNNTGHTNGVKSDNCFGELESFNVIDGFPPDLMHDFLEGVLVYQFGFMMNSLIKLNISRYF